MVPSATPPGTSFGESKGVSGMDSQNILDQHVCGTFWNSVAPPAEGGRSAGLRRGPILSPSPQVVAPASVARLTCFG